MKRTVVLLVLAVVLTAACSLSGQLSAEAVDDPVQSERRCGDGACDGPENFENCPADCGETSQGTRQQGTGSDSSGKLLFHMIENLVSSFGYGDTECYSFTLARYLDAGYVSADGSTHAVLELEGYPTHHVFSTVFENYYYISTLTDPVMEIQGVSMMDWDAQGQALREASFNGAAVNELVTGTSAFPGGAVVSAGNRDLLYLMTNPSVGDQAVGMIAGRFDPFVSDSSLHLMDMETGRDVEVLAGNTNRRLFSGMADFSADREWFYTMSRAGGGFQFVRINLETGDAENLQDVFPSFPWDSVSWDDFFPRENDFSYASFTMSPDESVLIAYKNYFTASMDNPCITAAEHRLWVFDFEADSLVELEVRPGYVSSAEWDPGSSILAVAVLGNSGCYPDYMDAAIRLLDRQGAVTQTLVSEPESKITNMSWSPDSTSLAYDVYSTDFIGRVKLADVATGSVEELINTMELGVEVDRVHPVVLLLADWME